MASKRLVIKIVGMGEFIKAKKEEIEFRKTYKPELQEGNKLQLKKQALLSMRARDSVEGLMSLAFGEILCVYRIKTRTLVFAEKYVGLKS